MYIFPVDDYPIPMPPGWVASIEQPTWRVATFTKRLKLKFEHKCGVGRRSKRRAWTSLKVLFILLLYTIVF
jgi:hypothetical protein